VEKAKFKMEQKIKSEPPTKVVVITRWKYQKNVQIAVLLKSTKRWMNTRVRTTQLYATIVVLKMAGADTANDILESNTEGNL
jgi:hypothetical protein